MQNIRQKKTYNYHQNTICCQDMLSGVCNCIKFSYIEVELLYELLLTMNINNSSYIFVKIIYMAVLSELNTSLKISIHMYMNTYACSACMCIHIHIYGKSQPDL